MLVRWGVVSRASSAACADAMVGKVATAALLNEAESREWNSCDQLGAWCVHPSQGLIFGGFHPALTFQDDSHYFLFDAAAFTG